MAIPGKKLSDPVRNKAIEMLASGEYTHEEVGTELDISERTSRRINEEYWEIIKEKAVEMAIDTLPDVTDIHTITISTARAIVYALSNPDKVDIQPILDTMEAMGLNVRDLLKLSEQKEARTLRMTQIDDARKDRSTLVQFIKQEANIVITEDMQEFMRWKAQRGARTFDLPDNTES